VLRFDSGVLGSTGEFEEVLGVEAVAVAVAAQRVLGPRGYQLLDLVLVFSEHQGGPCFEGHSAFVTLGCWAEASTSEGRDSAVAAVEGFDSRRLVHASKASIALVPSSAEQDHSSHSQQLAVLARPVDPTY
jgi:hypothetical protein